MSIQKRKLSYWSIDFLCGEKHSFNGTLFSRFLKFVNGLSDSEKIFRDEKNNKAVLLDNIINEIKQGTHLYKLIFKSCKFNHSPDYMSSNDGSERPSDKQLHEGDKELTHMCIRIDMSEAYTIFEERRNGVTIGGVIKYFNALLRRFLINNGINNNIYLSAGMIPSKDFMKALNDAKSISLAEMFVEKEVLRSVSAGLVDIDANSREDITITIKSKPRESLTKQVLKKAFISLSTEGTQLKRIRLYGKDDNKMNIIIDSLNGKRIEEVSVELTPNGTVDSYSIFAKIEECMGITE